MYYVYILSCAGDSSFKKKKKGKKKKESKYKV